MSSFRRNKVLNEQLMYNQIGIGYWSLVISLFVMAILCDYKQNTIIKFNRNKKYRVNVILLRIAFFIMWFMSAFRGINITNDTAAYLRTYRNISAYGMAGELRMEKGFVTLNAVLARIFPAGDIGFYVLLFISSVLIYYVLEQWIEKNASSYGVCILFFYFMCNGGYMSAVRQSMACAIVIIAISALRKGKKIRFLFLVVVASLFHKSALISLVFLLFYKKVFSLKRAAVILGMGISFLALKFPVRILNSILDGKSSYLQVTGGGNILSVLVNVGLYSAILILNIIEKKKKNTQNSFFAYCITFAIICSFASYSAPVFSRFTSYFSIIGIPYIANVLDGIKNKRIALLLKTILISSIWIYSLSVLVYRPEWQHLWPYQFYWNSL